MAQTGDELSQRTRSVESRGLLVAAVARASQHLYFCEGKTLIQNKDHPSY